MENTNNNDTLSKFWFIMSNILPPIGFYLYFKFREGYPNKARASLNSALIGIPIGMIGGYILNNFIIK